MNALKEIEKKNQEINKKIAVEKAENEKKLAIENEKNEKLMEEGKGEKIENEEEIVSFSIDKNGDNSINENKDKTVDFSEEIITEMKTENVEENNVEKEDENEVEEEEGKEVEKEEVYFVDESIPGIFFEIKAGSKEQLVLDSLEEVKLSCVLLYLFYYSFCSYYFFSLFIFIISVSS